MNREILHFSEEELFPRATQLFIRYSHLDLDNASPRHKKLWQIGQKARELGLHTIEPRAILIRCTEAGLEGDQLRLGEYSFSAGAMSKLPPGSPVELWAYVVTVGECLWQDSDPVTQQLCADIWGTAYVDAARSLLLEQIRSRCRQLHPDSEEKRLRLEDTWGPGFYGMPIEELAQLCQFLRADEIGVKPLGDGLMLPLKSCAGLCLLLPETASVKEPSCLRCPGGKSGCDCCRAKS